MPEPMEIERRYVPSVVEPIELEERSAAAPVIKGISPPFNSQSVDLGGFREVFTPNAFDKVVGRHRNDPRGGVDVVALFDHEGQPIGRTTNDTLKLSIADRGLAYAISPPDTTLGRDIVTLVRRGDLFGASFAFSIAQGGESWTQEADGSTLRTVTNVANLYDVSVVTRGAYPQATAALRSLGAWKAAVGQIQQRAEGSGLVISLDYDRTFTAAPGMWRSFVALAYERGNTVICISRREETEQNVEEIRSAFAGTDVTDIVLCGHTTQKRDAAAARGISVDVWIDDYPEGIVALETRKDSRPAADEAADRRRRWQYALTSASARLVTARLKTNAPRIK
jgi:HK97 family phage prohead protease